MRNLPARLFRALAVAVVVLSLSAGGHMGGGGNPPGPAVVVVLIAVTMMAVAVAAKRTLNLPTLLAILGGAQFAFHYAFQLPAPAPCVPADHAGPVPACHSVSAGAHQHGLDDGMGAGMLIAHLIATLLAAVVITRGEDALYAAAAWLRPLFHTLRPSAAPTLMRTRASFQGRTPRAVPFLTSPPLRGPPIFRCSRCSRIPRRLSGPRTVKGLL